MIKVGRGDVLWSYIAQFLSVASGLIVLPMVLKMLSPEEIGFNYIMLSVGTIAFLLDFGFSTQIQRFVTYVFSGAKELIKEGQPAIDKNEDKIDRFLFNQVFTTSKLTYGILSIVSIVLLSTFGTIYIYNITKGFRLIENSIVIWIIFIISTTFQIFYLYFSPILLGMGKVKEVRKATILSQISKILISYGMLLMDYGLISIVIANTLSVILGRIVNGYYLFDSFFKDLVSHTKVSVCDMKKMSGIFWHNSKRAGLHSLATILIYNCPILFIGAHFNLDVAGSYGLMYQCVSALLTASLTIYTTYLPKLTQLSIQGDSDELRSLTCRTMLIAWMLYVIGFTVLLITGNNTLRFAGANVVFPNFIIFLIYGIGRLVDGSYWAFVQLFSIKNTYPYVKTYIYTMITILALTCYVTTQSEWGLLGVVLATVVPRIVMNDFIWIKRSLLSIDLNITSFVRIGIYSILSQKTNR